MNPRHPDRLGAVDRPGPRPDDPPAVIGQPWSVALAANVKIFPALVALWWLGRRDYQAFVAFLLWIVPSGASRSSCLSRAGPSSSWVAGRPAQLGAVRNISPLAFGLPVLWVAFRGPGGLLTIRVAKTRWAGRLRSRLGRCFRRVCSCSMLTGLLAALREPIQPDAPDPNAPVWTPRRPTSDP